MMKINLLMTAVVLLALDIRGSAVRVHQKGATHSGKGSEFYLGFMQNRVTSQPSPTIPLFITTDEPQTVKFSVIAINPSFYLLAEARYGSVTTVHLPRDVIVTTKRTTPAREKTKGVHVKAENGKTISIVGSNAEQATTDSFLVLPVIDNPLKVRERYTILSNDFIHRSLLQGIVYSEFLLVGCRNNTKVRITPNNTGIEVPSIYNPNRLYVAAGQRVDFTLNRMETLLITSTSDLSGTVISSNEPISVFTGHECGQVPADVGTCDHLVEQVPPQHTWGVQFFTAPLQQESGDLFKMATTNAILTEVNMTCTEMGKNYSNSVFRALSLGKNEIFAFEQGPHTYCCIEATNPLLVMQLGKGSALNDGVGDPLLVTIPAVQQYNNNFTVVQDRFSLYHYLNIIVPVQYFEDTPQGHGHIRINNVTASRSWSPIFCSTGQICAYGAQVPLNDQVSTVVHEDPEAGMSISVYGFGIDVAHGYSAGYNLDPIAFPIVSLEPGEHRVRGTSDNVTLVITRRGNIQTPLTLHLTSDFIDPVGEVELLRGQLRKEVSVTVRTGLLPMSTDIVTVLLSYSGNEDVILIHTEANITILDAIEVGFENSSYTVDEDTVRVILTIAASIPNPEPDPLNFTIRTLGGTAQYEDDYRNVDSILTLAPMEQSLKYEVIILDDQRVEKLEVFSVLLGIAPGQERVSGLTLGQSVIDIFIKDNDCVTVVLEPTNLTLYENESDALIKVHKLGLSDLTISVLVSTKDLSTTAHLDYESLVGSTVVFQPEDTERSIHIKINTDDIVESDEQFLLQLSPIENQHVCLNQSTSGSTAIITILNDDMLTFHFERVRYTFKENAEFITLSVLKEGSHQVPTTVHVQTQSQLPQSQAAIDGADYIGTNKTLTFHPEQSVHTVSIYVIDDDITEDNEHFTVSLILTEAGVQTSPPQDAIITIIDNDEVEIGLNNTVYSVAEGDGEVRIAVHSEGQLERKIKVLLSTKDGSAKESADYSGHSEILEFGSRASVLQIGIPILADNTYEQLESFTVELKPLNQSGVKIESSRSVARVDIIDDDTAVGFSSEEYTANENDNSIELLIIKKGQMRREIELQYVTQPVHPAHENSALANFGGETVVTFDESEAVHHLILPLVDDNVVEANEIIQIKLSITVEDSVELTADTATVIIVDDDEAMFQFDPQNVTVSESKGRAMLHIHKAGMATIPLRVIFSTVDFQATVLQDYISKREVVTFQHNETQKSLAVDIVDDAIYEGPETFQVVLRAASSGVVVDETPSWVIIVDQDDFVRLRFVASQVVVEESQGSAQIVVTKIGHNAVPVVVAIKTEDSTATAIVDYVPITMEMVFTPEDAVKSFNVTVVPDQIFENVERFDVVLSLMDDTGMPKVLDTLSVLITDSPSGLVIALDATRDAVMESEGEMVFTVKVIGQLEREVLLHFSTNDNDASAGKDYELTSLSLTLSPNQLAVSFGVPIVNDHTVEGEETFEGVLSTSLEQVMLINSTVNITILDDDKICVKFDQLEYSASEDESVVTLRIRKEGLNDIPIHIIISTEDGSATKHLDYITTFGGLIFGPHDSILSFNITLINDDTSEDEEIFHVLLGSPTAQSSYVKFESYNASVTIIDQDIITIGFPQAELFVNETEGILSLMILKEGEANIDIHIEILLEDDSATGYIDYVYEGHMALLQPEDQVLYINITIVDDDIPEAMEIFIAKLRVLSNKMGINLVNSTLPVNIIDDDYVILKFDSTNMIVQEEEGMLNLSIIKLRAAAVAVTVVITTQAQEAQSNEDYVKISESIMIEPNQTRVILTIPILNDRILERNESFTVQLVAGEKVIIEEDLATIWIIDDDVAQVGFVDSQYVVAEGNESAEICVTTSIPVDFDLDIFIIAMPTTSSIGDDFVLLTPQVTLGDGQGIRCVVVDIISDQATEDTEEFQLRLYLNESKLQEIGRVVLFPDTATISIIDDDRVHVGFESSSYLVKEGGHSIDVCALVKTGHIQNTAIHVNVFILSETAKIDADFVVGNSTLVFTDTDLRQCITLIIIDDTIIEMKERVTIELKHPEPHDHYELLQGNTSVVIEDNDDIEIGFARSAYSVVESEGVITVEVLLHQPSIPTFPIPVTIHVQPNDADESTDWSLENSTFILTDLSFLLSIIVNSDNKVENNESFSLMLHPHDPRPGFKPMGGEAVITILDNDNATVSYEFSSYVVNEDVGVLELSIILVEGTLERNISIAVSTVDLDARFVEDFVVIESALIFSAGSSAGDEQMVNVKITDDHLVEPDEKFLVEITSEDDAVQLATMSAQITITDNDVIKVKFSSDSYSVTEGEEAEVCLIFEAGQLKKDLHLSVVSHSDTANIGEDYDMPSTFPVTLKPGDNQSCFTVETKEDNLVEGDETFQLILTSSDQDVFMSITDTLIVHIEDNDVGVFGLEAAMYTVAEGNDLIVPVYLLENELAVPIFLEIKTSAISATVEVDYLHQTFQLIFQEGSKARSYKNISITVLSDAVVENQETFHISLIAVSPLAEIREGRNSTIGIIQDTSTVEIGFEMSQYFLREGVSHLTVCLRLQGGRLDRAVNVTLTTRGDTAQANADYSDVVITDFLPADGNLKCVDIAIADDKLVEMNESFSLFLSTMETALSLRPAVATVTIIDNDKVTLALRQNHITVQESDGEIEIVIELVGDLQREVVILLKSVDGTASFLRGDYAGFSEVLTFHPGSKTGSMVSYTTTLEDDHVVEELEYFVVHATSLDEQVLFESQRENTTVYIEDNDMVGVMLESTSYSVVEGAAVDVCAMLSGELEREVQLSLVSQPGSAQQDEDYVAIISILTLLPGDNHVCFSVETLEDNIVEGEERFQILLNANDPAAVTGGVNVVNVTIKDNDNAVFGLQTSEYTVGDDESNITVTIYVLGKELALPVELQLTSLDISASNGGDYIFVPTILRVPSGSKSGDIFLVSIVILPDSIVENTESFQLILSSLNPLATIDQRMRNSIINITDKNTINIGFEQTLYTVQEDVTQQEICMIIEGGTLARSIDLNISSSDVTALAPDDYIKISYITSYSHSDGARKCINITIMDDDLVENMETFILHLTSKDEAVSLMSDRLTLTIIDNDKVLLALQQTSFTVNESIGQLEVSVGLNGKLERNVTFSLKTNDETALAQSGDYTAISELLIFSPGNSSNISLFINIHNDHIVERQESFSIQAVSSDSAVQFEVDKETAFVFIDDDDTLTVNFMSSSYSAFEGGTVEVCIILESDQLERIVQLSLFSQSDTAQENADYVALLISVTWEPDTNQKCFSIRIVDDYIVEGEESFQIVLASHDPAVVVPTPAAARVTIQDDDSGVFAFEFSEYTINENAEKVIVSIVLLETELAVPVSLQLSALDISAFNGEDYSLASTVPVEFQQMSVPGDKVNVSIAILADDVIESQEIFKVTLSSSSSPLVSALDDSIITIIDHSATTVAFEKAEYYVYENDTSLEVCVTHYGGMLSRALDLTITSSSGSANDVKDYSKMLLTILFSESDGDRLCFNVTIIDDLLLENNENFTLLLMSTDSAVSVKLNMTSVTILDDDIVTLYLQPMQLTVTESSQQVQVTIILMGGLEREVSLMLGSNDGTASSFSRDYNSLSNRLVFPTSSAASSSLSVNVTIIDDLLVEEMEYFTVHVFSMDAAAHFIPGRNSTTFYIEDDDMIGIKFESTSYLVEEGATLKVCVTVESGQLERNINLSVASIPDSADESYDYNPVSLVLTLLSGENYSCFNIETLDDQVVEGWEAFTVFLRSQDKAAIISINTTIISIHDSDRAVFGLEFPLYFIEENDESIVVSILLLEKDLGLPLSLQLTTTDLTAVAGVDYTPSSKLVTFQTGSKSGDKQSVSVATPLMDNIVENTESFQVLLTTVSSMATVRSDTENATVNIADQSSVSIGFEKNHYYTTENQSQIEICMVLLSGHLDRPLNLLVSTSNNSAHTPMDYTELMLMISLEGIKRCFNVDIVDDQHVENDESFLLTLNSTDVAVSLNLPVVVTIINDDHVMIGFQQSRYTIIESSGRLDLVIDLIGFLEKNVSLIVESHDRTASVDRGDYTAISESLVFPSGSMAGSALTLKIEIGDDNNVEEEEYFTISLRSLDVDMWIKEAKKNALIFIEDDDFINVGLESASYSIVEGEAAELCVVVHNGELERNVELDISIVGLSGSAEEKDFKLIMSTISLRSAQNLSCTTLEILKDNLVEGEEIFQMILSSKDSAVIISNPNTASVTIQDLNTYLDHHFTEAVLGFELTDYFVGESDGSLTVSVVLLNNELRVPTSVLLSIEDVSATSGIDYIFMATTLIFPLYSKPGYVKNITITILSDSFIENTEYFQLHLSNSSGHTTIDKNMGNATVAIHDQSVVTIGFEVSEYSLHEGTSSLEVCILLQGGQLHRPVNIALFSNDRTALAQVDYAEIYTTEFEPADGNTRCVDITIKDDTLVERDETFTLALSSNDTAVHILPHSATVMIIDNDQAVIGFVHNSYTTLEGTGEVEIGIQLLDGPSLEREIVVYVESSDESALSINGDYIAFRKMLTFPQGSSPYTMLPLEVAINDDNLVEGLEYFTVHMGTTDDVVVGKQNSTIVIKDNDSISIMMESSLYSIVEGEMMEVCVAVKSGELESAVQFSILSHPASAQEEDYNSTFISISLSPGENRVCFPIETLEDNTVEGEEIFHLILSSQNPAVDISTPNLSVITIEDDDAIDVRLEFVSYTVAEGGTVEVCVVVQDGQFERSIQLSISSQPGSAQEEDYDIYVEHIVLQPLDEKSCVMVETQDDDLVEGIEAFQVTITSSDVAVVTTTPSTTTIQITDNDYARFGFESSEYTFNEGPGIKPVVIMLLEHELTSPVSVQFSVADLSATWGTDYNYQHASVTFSSGEKSGDTHTIFVDIKQDTIVEATESFQFYLSCQNPLASIDSERRVSTVHITDQTTAMIGFESAHYVVRENTPQLRVCLILQDGRELARPVDFTVSSSDGTAQAPEDYISMALTTRFVPSQGHRKYLQLMTVDDWRLEDNEMLTLSLTLADPSIFLGLDQTSVTILDNDRVMVGLQQTLYTVEESIQQMELTIQLLGDIEREVSVMLESKDGTAIASDGDYIPFVEVLTFFKGSNYGSTRSARVYIQDDPLVERSEYFTVHLSPMDASVQIQQSTEDATIYIISDDVISSDITLPTEGIDNGDDNERSCTKRSRCRSGTRSRTKSKKTRRSHESRSRSEPASRPKTKSKKTKKGR